MSNVFVSIPRGSGKLMAIIAQAIELAKEGNKVEIDHVGGTNIVIEPIETEDETE